MCTIMSQDCIYIIDLSPREMDCEIKVVEELCKKEYMQIVLEHTKYISPLIHGILSTKNSQAFKVLIKSEKFTNVLFRSSYPYYQMWHFKNKKLDGIVNKRFEKIYTRTSPEYVCKFHNFVTRIPFIYKLSPTKWLVDEAIIHDDALLFAILFSNTVFQSSTFYIFTLLEQVLRSRIFTKNHTRILKDLLELSYLSVENDNESRIATLLQMLIRSL